MRKYTVAYRPWSSGEAKEKTVSAKNAYDAWEAVASNPQEDGSLPYSAWVTQVTYANGKKHTFNSSEGNPLGE